MQRLPGTALSNSSDHSAFQTAAVNPVAYKMMTWLTTRTVQQPARLAVGLPVHSVV